MEGVPKEGFTRRHVLPICVLCHVHGRSISGCHFVALPMAAFIGRSYILLILVIAEHLNAISSDTTSVFELLYLKP